jgi:hypothetical protein
MKPVEFDMLLQQRIDLMKSSLLTKGREYAMGDDRLSNFKRSGALLQRSQSQAVLAFLTKHITSIFDLVELRDAGENIPMTLFDEKIGDAINYLVLLEATLKERD